MFPTLFVLLLAVAGVGVSLAAAKVFRASAPKVMLGLGGLVVVGTLAWAAFEYPRVGDGPSCSVCVISPEMVVAIIAATGVSVGTLVALAGAATWGIAAFRARRAARPPSDLAT